MLVRILDKYDLKKEMKNSTRDYFSIEACEALIELFYDSEILEEVDTIAISCEFQESDPKEIISEYGWDDEFDVNNIELDILLDHLNDKTIAVKLDNGKILYQRF